MVAESDPPNRPMDRSWSRWRSGLAFETPDRMDHAVGIGASSSTDPWSGGSMVT